MKTNRRWMNWVLEESAKEQAAMPWTRGKRPQRAQAAAQPLKRAANG